MPSTFDRDVAEARTRLYSDIRAYFYLQKVLEVEVPLLGFGGSTDVHLASMTVVQGGSARYLQTSPEFFMKRLLCDGSGDIFTLCKAFRAEELGRFHSPEFSLLEWYRVGFSLDRLIDDLVALIQSLGVHVPVARFSYAEVFQKATGLNPHEADPGQLRLLAQNQGLVGELDLDGLLDFIVTKVVEPSLPEGLVILDQFPACQAALAKISENDQGEEVAQRFEIYWDGLELANGYQELTDGSEQRRRFELDNQQRATKGLPAVEWDQEFLQALERGMPECAGVAVGVDRLLMRMLGKHQLSDAMMFAWDRL